MENVRKVIEYQMLTPNRLTEVKELRSDEQLGNPSDIASFFRRELLLDERAEEYVYMLALNQRCMPIGIFEIAHGTVNGSYVSPREIFMRALLVGAVSIVMTHNHPSGSIEPSREDDELTERIKKSGALLNVPLLDHIIIGSNGKYYSYQEDGKL